MGYDLDNFLEESEEMQDLIMEQVGDENKFLEDATSKYEHSVSRMLQAGLFASTTEGSILQKMAIEAVSEQIKAYFNTRPRGQGAIYLNYLKENFEGREEVLAFTILEHLLNVVSTRTSKVTAVSIRLTGKVLDLLSVEQFKKNEPRFYSYLEYEYKTRGIGYINSRKKKLSKMTGNDEAVGKETVFKTNIGARLIDCVISSGCNLFTTRIIHKGKKTEKVLILTEDALNIVGKVKNRNVLFSVTYKPLVAPPLPWTSIWGDGGYYTSNNLAFIRNQKVCRYIENNYPEETLDRAFNVINSIQSTEWKVNTYILDVVNTIIDDSMVDPNTPKGNPKFYGALPYMDSLDVYEMIPKERYGELDERGVHKSKEDYKRWFTDKEIQLKKLEANRSKRIMFTLAHNIATEYRDREKMYFSYNTDFRGRLYPIQQILNPQSTGAVKSFLEFAKGQILDDKGAYWLKVHIANNYGMDKKSFDERVAWVDEHKDSILACAKDPIDTIEVWNEADEPLMYLAGCKAFLDYSEGNTVHLPISLDATCSGLQLYSGLLMDRQGAEAVNVVDRTEHGSSVKPADVYTDVADKVEEYLASGEYPDKFTFKNSDGEMKTVTTEQEAKDLQGNVTRKLTKRNVMTVPYSVTKRGMFEQVRDLFSEMEDDEEVFWNGDKWVLSKLLVELNSKAITEIVEGASVGQEFVKMVTKEYYQDNNDMPMVWSTPFFNFPVVQWKIKNKLKRVKSVFGYLSLQLPTNKINKQQQVNGIAPNFIHSLDATLMYLTVEKLLEQGVDGFMLIHDSFGVPANDVELLNDAVRESFVELFKSHPLHQWVSQVSPEYLEESESILLNTLDIDEVLDSTYIFS